ncbi:putative F-box protein At5g42430 [Ipomoea triloba]|uniref:putative F-box protein At5g42430 n=1 Tax=Ipomoea triloba TaxID=35885 RepID=UPI00125E4904|nr:putative F-box protein At5g42430 [Ipomoea triloba]
MITHCLEVLHQRLSLLREVASRVVVEEAVRLAEHRSAVLVLVLLAVAEVLHGAAAAVLSIKLQRQMNNPSTSSSSTSITSLPREILLKILTGLPAKSAVRFRCTSKFFYSFIPEPRFAFRILVSLQSKTPPGLNLYSVNYHEDSHGNLQADTAQPLGVRGLVCSADGKMCLLSHASGDDAVFDLSTGRHIWLPSRISWSTGRAVLGFDSVSERYKVFNSEVYYDSDRQRVMNQLWVLTVGVDKLWRKIDASTITGYTQTAVHINGIIYLIPLITESMTGCWTRLSESLKNLFDSSNIEPKIVAMDVSTERFIRYIPLPSECLSPQYRRGWLPWVKLNGRLAFINILSPQKAKSLSPSGAFTSWPNKINIWTLERSMEWEKQTVGLPLEEREVIGEAIFLGFTANSMGEIVFLILRKTIMSPLVLLYSFRREVWKRFEIHGVCSYSLSLWYMRGVVHVEEENATFLD